MKTIEIEENRIYIGKPLDIVGILEDWVRAEFEMYYNNDRQDSMHLEFAQNWCQKASYVVEEWIGKYGENNFVKADIGEDRDTYIELTPFHISEMFEKDNFYEDLEKMDDFRCLTKYEFLGSYSYLTEEEYDNTLIIDEYLNLLSRERNDER